MRGLPPQSGNRKPLAHIYQDRALHLQGRNPPRNLPKSGRHGQLLAVFSRSQLKPLRRDTVGRPEPCWIELPRNPLLLWQGLPGLWLSHWRRMSKRRLDESVASGCSTPFTLCEQSFQGVCKPLLTSTAFGGYRRFIHLRSSHEDIQFVYQPFVAVRWPV